MNILILLLIHYIITSAVLRRTLALQCKVAQECVTDLTDADCDTDEVLVPNTNIFGCCPSCLPSIGVTEPGACKPPANCLPDGKYAPVQCKGDLFTGRCFCSDENGRRIFGQMWRSEAKDMTCACSRRRAELELSGRKDVTIHCTHSGDYEPLQCDNSLCWCAQPRTGQPVVPPVPQEDMKRLPCYSASTVGENYLRRCESIVYALTTIYKEQTEHGTTFLGKPTIFCDYDGSYGPYRIENEVAFCTNRDGSNLGSWNAHISEISKMNCNCARDTMIYFKEHGMTVTETCQPNGNYRPNQNVDDVYYCVDTDGYPTEISDRWPPDLCASYA